MINNRITNILASTGFAWIIGIFILLFFFFFNLVSNAITVEENCENSVTVQFYRNRYPNNLSGLSISYATMCNFQNGTEMPPSSMPVKATENRMVIGFGPQATNCFFTVQLLSDNNERIGFPIGGNLVEACGKYFLNNLGLITIIGACN